MLEILALFALTKKIGKIVEAKGRKARGYKVLTVVLWFGFEILGAIVGAVVTEGEEQLVIYLFALGGAVIGAVIAFVIANSVSPVLQPSQSNQPSQPGQPNQPINPV